MLKFSCVAFALMVLPVLAFSLDIGISAKDLLSKKGIPTSFSAAYGEPSNTEQLSQMNDAILSPTTPGWKRQLLLSLYPSGLTFFPVLDYGNVEYRLKNNLVFMVIFKAGSDSQLPFSLKLGDNLATILSKVPATPFQQKDMGLTSGDSGQKEYLVEYKGLVVNSVTCDLDIRTYDGGLARVIATAAQ